MAAQLRRILVAALGVAVIAASACGDDPVAPTNTTIPSPTNQQPAVTLQLLSVSPSSVQAPTQPTGQVTLSAAATSAVIVSLQSGNTAVARVPASVTVATGASTATFAIETLSVTAATNVSITGTYSGITRSATLTVTAPAVPPPNPNPTPNPNRTFWMGLSGNRVGCTGGFLDIVLLENNVGQQGTLTLCNQDTLQPLAWMSAAPISIGPVNAINDREVVFDVYLANLTATCKFHPNFTFYQGNFPNAFLFNFPPDLVPAEQWHGTRTLFFSDNARVTARASGDSYIHSCQ
jgi:hypothetical protein